MMCKQCGVKPVGSTSLTGLCRSCAQKAATEKRKQTLMARYGVDNPMKKREFIDKITDTFMTRYGVKRAMSVPQFREKFEQTCNQKYGVPYYVETEEYRSRSQFRISEVNKAFAKYLDDWGLEYTQEFAIEGKVYDFCLPQQKVLIEIDPSYTHNVIGNHWNPQGIAHTYHVEKTRLAEAHGYRCIHVFDWDNPIAIITSLVRISTVYARKCQILEPSKEEADRFLQENHLQGTCKGQTIRAGLYDVNGTLVQLITFGRPRYNKNYTWELLRLCTHRGITVVGGASKLFHYCVEHYQLDSIISYCDKAKFTGTVYEKIGMTLLRHSDPQDTWSKGNEHITANYLRQQGFDRIFGTNFGKGTSNEQLMVDAGWLPVFDCGQLVFEYRTDRQSTPAEDTTTDTALYKDLVKKDREKRAKPCAFCGKMFVPNSNFQRYCKGPHIRQCPACGKEYKETNNENLKRPPHACSYPCRVIMTQRTSMERYGMTAPGNNPNAREKAKQTCLANTGHEYAMQSADVRAKAVATLQERYGVDNIAKTPEEKKRRSERMKGKPKKLFSPTITPAEENISITEEWLEKFGISYMKDAPVADYTHEFYLPDQKIVIDLGGFIQDRQVRRVDVTASLARAGYRCIHIFDWDDPKKIVEMLKPRRPVYARKCTVWRINAEPGCEFLRKYHLQNSCRGQLLYLGLVLDSELLQVMTFGKSRYDKQHDVELLRLCTKPGITVVGGASRLFSYATSEYGLHNIISYCDLSKFTGDVYEKMGMTRIRTTPPSEVWTRGGKKITANLLRQRGFDQLFSTHYGKGTSNEQLMLDHGWLPVYDCGQAVYEFR